MKKYKIICHNNTKEYWLPVHILDKIDFKGKYIIWNKEGHILIRKHLIHEKCIKIIQNLYNV